MALDSKSGSRKINQHVDLAPGARNLTTTGNITAGAFYGDGSHLTGVTTASANDALITITAGGGLTGGGGFTVDQAVDAIITVSHSDTSAQASVANTAFNVIQSITLDTYGHITAIESQDIGTAGFYVKTTGETGTGVKIGLGSLTYQTVQFFAGTGLSVVRTDNEIQFSAPNAANWNSAYNYSQIGHLPLAGGTITGNLDVDGIIDNTRNNTNAAPPSTSDHTVGTRIKFWDSSDVFFYALGIENGHLWSNADVGFKWYQRAVEKMSLSDGNLTVSGTLSASGYNNTNWDEAFGWGNHAGLYAPSGYGIGGSSILGSGDNANSKTLTGFYYFAGSSNIPTTYFQAGVLGSYNGDFAQYGIGSNQEMYFRWGDNSWKTIIHSGNIGGQSVNYATGAGNASTLDTLDSSQFLRSDESDTMTGSLTVNGAGVGITVTSSQNTGLIVDGGTNSGIISEFKFGARKAYISTSGNIYASGLFDIDNTNYYVNPASTSVLAGLTVAGPIYQGASNQGVISLLSDIIISETNNYFRLYLPQGYVDNRNGGAATIKVVWGQQHAGITYSHEYKLTFGTNHSSGGNYLIVSDVTRTYKDQNPDSYGGYVMDQTPAVDFYYDASGGYINFNVKGIAPYNTHRVVSVDIVGGGIDTPVLSYYGTTSPGGTALTVKDIPYATNAGYANDTGTLDGIDSTRIIYGDNSTGTSYISGATLDTALKSGFYTTNGGVPNASAVNFVLHTAYYGEGNLAGFDLACNDSTSSSFYLRPATGGGKGAWQTIITSSNIGSQSVSYASSANTSSTTAHYASRTDSSWYNAVWAAGNPSHLYSADSVQIQSSTGSIKANVFYDNNNTDYYVDPSATSNLSALNVGGQAVITAGNIGSQSVSYAASSGNADTVDSLHASSFVRSDQNTVTIQRHLDASTTWTNSIISLFLGWNGGKVVIGNNGDGLHDAASAEGANSIVLTNATYSFKQTYMYHDNSLKLYMGSDGTRNTGWAYHTNNGTGIHWPNNGWHLYPVNGSDFYVRSGSNECSLKFTKSGETGSYVHCSSVDDIGFLTTGRAWSLRVDNSGNTFATSSSRAPIFYDSNNTDYYLDPTAGTNSKSLMVDGFVGWPNHQWTWSRGAHQDPTNSIKIWDQYSNYGGSGNPTAYGTILHITGRASHEDDQLYFSYDGQILHRNAFYGSDSWSSWNSVATARHSFTNNVDLRAPIFYDSNNTGYYTDPASTSSLNEATFNRIGVGQGTNSNYRIIVSGDYYANAGGNYWAEGRFKQYRGSGTWHDVIDSGNIGSQSVSYATTARELTTNYAGGQQLNPQVYFNINYGLKVAMTAAWGYWSDTLWINGYAGGDVLQMCALHTQRNGQPRIGISVQASNSTSYGTIYELWSSYNMDAPNKSGTSYYQTNTWMQFNGGYGLYWPSNYGAHFYPNDYNTYVQFRLSGSKNGYGGIVDSYSGVSGIMYDSAGNGGVYREATGRWYFYHHLGNNCTGINTSTTSSAYGLYVDKGIYSTGDITAYSDVRKKTNIATIDSALDKVTRLRGVYYDRIDDLERGRQIGVIAQEVNEVLPEAVTYAEDIDEYGVKYGNIVGVLIEAIKEQNQLIEDLRQRISKLEA